MRENVEIKISINKARLLWHAIHEHRQRIQQEIKVYEQEGITWRGIKEGIDIDQLKKDHDELLKMEKDLEDIFIG